MAYTFFLAIGCILLGSWDIRQAKTKNDTNPKKINSNYVIGIVLLCIGVALLIKLIKQIIWQ